MQEEFKAGWRRMVYGPDESEPNDLPDFGFCDPDGITDWATAYIQSGYNPGHLPRPGGIRGQTKADRLDLETFLRGYSWTKFQKDHPEDDILKQMHGET